MHPNQRLHLHGLLQPWWHIALLLAHRVATPVPHRHYGREEFMPNAYVIEKRLLVRGTAEEGCREEACLGAAFANRQDSDSIHPDSQHQRYSNSISTISGLEPTRSGGPQVPAPLDV